MEARELEIKEKWGPVTSQSDEDLKKIAKDLYNGLIFCDRQCPNDIMSVFMVLLFMGPRQPESPKYQMIQILLRITETMLYMMFFKEMLTKQNMKKI